MKTSKIFLSILDGIVVAGLWIFSFELSLYLANKLYHSNYIQNIHHTTDFTQLTVLDIFIGINGGWATLLLGTLASWLIGRVSFEFIQAKIIQIYKKWQIVQ
jgi:hypothetical protein